MKKLLWIPWLMIASAQAHGKDRCQSETYLMKREHRLECFVTDRRAREEALSVMGAKLDDVRLAEALNQLASKYPDEYFLEMYAAVMDGDAGQVISGTVEAQNKRRSVQRLQKILETRRQLPAFVVDTINNEIYYHSGLFYSQYILGLSGQHNGWVRFGGFSAGVGASEHAYQKLLEGKMDEARYFAERSIEGWKARAQGDEGYLSRQTFYIMALAMTGELEKAKILFKKHQESDPHAQVNRIWYERYQKRLEKIASVVKSKP